jgi:transcriptional regulator with XRE-family HTH domain
MTTQKLRSELAVFLNHLRRRIDPDSPALGAYVRGLGRLGKRVTQEELAEAIGVTREWYAVLETAGTTRASTSLLERLADALMVTPEERATLFYLAVPQMGRAQLRRESVEVLEAFSRLRSLTKPLWSATSPEELFTAASEKIADWFDGLFLVGASTRSESGRWKLQAGLDKPPVTRVSEAVAHLEAVESLFSTSAELDALYLYPQLIDAGDTGTLHELQPLPVQRVILKQSWCQTAFTVVMARVRSRSGLVGGFSVAHELGHSYSASDRAALGAVAEFTSLALS